MTDQEARNVTELANNLGTRLIGSLPAQFLMLCILNLVFIGGMLWFLDRREMQKERLLGPYLLSCEKQIPTEAMMQLLERLQKK